MTLYKFMQIARDAGEDAEIFIIGTDGKKHDISDAFIEYGEDGPYTGEAESNGSSEVIIEIGKVIE